MVENKKGICDGRGGRYNHCGKERYIYTKSRGQCQECARVYQEDKKKKRVNIKSVSSNKAQKLIEKAERIKKNNEYYIWAINENIKRNNGVCRCDNCREKIYSPTGSNVSHIVGQGANGTLYYHPINHFIFGSSKKYDKCNCEEKFSDMGKRDTMAIYPIFLERQELLNREYYINT